MELRPYQVEALGKIKTGSILNGVTGSGKSITALAYFFTRVCRGSYKPYSEPKKPIDLYIITTAKKRDSGEWLEDCAYFRIGESIGPIKLTIDSWNNISHYRDIENKFFIFDEQRVCGSGKWACSFLMIAKKNNWIILSATPGDQWLDYVSVFIANGFYKNRTDFYRQHVVFDRFAKYPKVDRYINTSKLEYYRDHILVKMDYDRKTVREYKIVHVIFDKDLYCKVTKDRWNPFDNCPIENVSQFCYLQRKVVNSNSSRLRKLKQIYLEHPRIILFYNFTYELEMLRKWAKRNHIRIKEWNGQIHDPLPRSKSWIYLVQYMAGSEGWNCTTTDTIVFYSLPYSYKQFEQAAGRIDRMNTKYKILRYFIFQSKSVIDSAIRKCLDEKKIFNEKAYLKNIEKRPKNSKSQNFSTK